MTEHPRRRDLARSLASPHPERVELAEVGIADWAARLSSDQVADLLKIDHGAEIRWIAGEGWLLRRPHEPSTCPRDP